MVLLVCLLLSFPDPAQAAAHLKQGLVALNRGDLAEARAQLEEASREQPENPFAWTSLAQTYLRLEELKKAEDAAGKAQKLSRKDPVAAHALGIFYFGYAQALLRREDFTHAAEVLTSALSSDPENAQLILALGVARYGQRRFEEAIVSFLKVIRLDPERQQPYHFLGRMLDQAGPHLAEITSDFEAHATREPEDGEAQLLLAKALLAGPAETNAGNARAEELLRRAAKLDDLNWEAHYELGTYLESRRDYAGAADELTRSITLDPKQPMPHYHLARVYARLGKPEQAQAEREMHQRLSGLASPK